jgi:GGDEF domain-containing protein
LGTPDPRGPPFAPQDRVTTVAGPYRLSAYETDESTAGQGGKFLESMALLRAVERIRQGFANAAKEVDGRSVAATVSIGLAYCQEATRDVAHLLAQSDQALYLAKEQ